MQQYSRFVYQVLCMAYSRFVYQVLLLYGVLMYTGSSSAWVLRLQQHGPVFPVLVIRQRKYMNYCCSEVEMAQQAMFR